MRVYSIVLIITTLSFISAVCVPLRGNIKVLMLLFPLCLSLCAFIILILHNNNPKRNFLTIDLKDLISITRKEKYTMVCIPEYIIWKNLFKNLECLEGYKANDLINIIYQSYWEEKDYKDYMRVMFRSKLNQNAKIWLYKELKRIYPSYSLDEELDEKTKVLISLG